MKSPVLWFVLATCWGWNSCENWGAQEPNSPPLREIVIREGLGLGGSGGRSRVSLPLDYLESLWVRGEWKSPQDGEEITLPGGNQRTWRRIQAGDDLWFTDRAFAGGTLVTSVDVPADQVWLLDAQGHGSVRINGETRMGDVYANGSMEVPVRLHRGKNELIFLGNRGRLKARLYLPSKPLALSLRDTTFPTPIRGELEPLWGAVLLVNATEETITGLELKTSGEWLQTATTAVPALPPLSTRKVPFQARPQSDFPAGDLRIELQLKRAGHADAIDMESITWSAREPHELHRRTFVSKIDGSVQYYAVRPAIPSETKKSVRALFLSLHGAAVEGEGQAAVYAPQANGIVVAPTNRRPFGFDWEDWGRIDALEVLNLASQRFDTDPRRTYLTGHSMGGHGTWHLGSLFPDRFSAIGPSAGWISFATYVGGRIPTDDSEMEKMLGRSLLASDTLTRLPNLASQGVYVLHGDADDNVPVGQARTMREQLAKFHPDFVYKEQPGAGHWWGNACVDWPPLIEFLTQHQLPTWEQVTNVSFVTPNPAISARCHWATIAAQLQQGLLSRLDLQLDRAGLKFSGTTDNVAHLVLDLSHLPAVVDKPDLFSVQLDGETLESIARPIDDKLWLRRIEGQWQTTKAPSLADKGPHRYGPFKEAFQNRFMLVYGTQGTDDENAWMLAKARFDAESFRYRGNASVDVVADGDWIADQDHERSVAVYGNATINSAWQVLLSDSPIQVARNELRAGDLSTKGESMMTLFIRPRPGSDQALVAAIGGTDLTAMRATTRLPVFLAGTGYPDALVASPDFLIHGHAAVRLAGYFGLDWSLATGNWAKAD